MDRVSIPTIAGDLAPWVGVDVAIVTPLADATLSAAAVTVLTAPTGGSLVVEIRTASTLLATITLATGERTNSFTGSVAVASGTQLFLRVASLVGFPTDLSGYLAFDADVLLTSVARVKEFLGITGTDRDALLLEIVEAESRAIEGWIGRPVAQRTYTAERYRGMGSRSLVLNGYPVIGSPVLRLSGTALTINVDFKVGAADGIIERIIGGDEDATLEWWQGADIEVDSVRGYATVPTDLRLAATKQCAHEFKQTQAGGGRLGLIGSAPDRGGAAQYAPGGLLPEVLQVLDRYREVRVPWRG